jgi:hypothetical protein
MIFIGVSSPVRMDPIQAITILLHGNYEFYEYRLGCNAV